MTRELGKRVGELRRSLGLTQEELAARSGLPIYSIRNWEQGQRTPGVVAVYQLAKALGLPMERFVEGLEGEAPRAKKARGRKRGKS
jgi:transcriptional regulator with XRE-family HTH domain